MKVAAPGKDQQAAVPAAVAHEGPPTAGAQAATSLAEVLAASPRSVAQRASIAALLPGHGSPRQAPVQRMLAANRGGGGMGDGGGGGRRYLPKWCFQKDTASSEHKKTVNAAVGEVEDDAERVAELERSLAQLQDESQELEASLEEYQTELEQARQELDILRDEAPPSPEDVRHDARVEVDRMFPGEDIDDQTMDEYYEELDLPDVQQAEEDFEEYNDTIERLEDRISELESLIEEAQGRLEEVEDETAQINNEREEIQQRRHSGPVTRSQGLS